MHGPCYIIIEVYSTTPEMRTPPLIRTLCMVPWLQRTTLWHIICIARHCNRDEVCCSYLSWLQNAFFSRLISWARCSKHDNDQHSPRQSANKVGQNYQLLSSAKLRCVWYNEYVGVCVHERCMHVRLNAAPYFLLHDAHMRGIGVCVMCVCIDTYVCLYVSLT